MAQTGINQFLGALRQIGVHDKELSGRAVEDVYGSPLPPSGDAAARLATFRGRVSAGGGDDEQRDDNSDRLVTPIAHRPRHLAAAPLGHATKSGQ